MKKLKKINDVKIKTLEDKQMKNLAGGTGSGWCKTSVNPNNCLDIEWDNIGTGQFDQLWACIGL
jgi:natural product precursor